jgi:hypothetical protein
MGIQTWIDRLLSDANDYHIPFAGVVFLLGSVMQWFHRLDASYIAFTSTVLTFIGTHAWMKSKNGGDDSQTGKP